MLFSIIIPVHNSEKFIDNCIEKCLSQSFSDFEIIPVVNCSTDRSEEICREWAERDDRVKLVVTEQSGVSNARNTGIARACGEWIVFVDSDDYLLPDAFSIMAKNIDNNIDMLCCNYVQGLNERELTDNTKTVSSKEYILAMLDPITYLHTTGLTWKAGVLGVNWGKAFRRTAITDNGVSFNKKITIFEDLLFNLDFLKTAGKIRCLDTAVYFYYVNTSSLSRTNSIERIRQRLDYVDNLLEQINSSVFSDNDIISAMKFQAAQNMIRTFVVASGNKDKNVRKLMKEYLDRPECRELIKGLRGNKLSLGKVQAKFYILLLFLLKRRMYVIAYAAARTYSKTRKKV